MAATRTLCFRAGVSSMDAGSTGGRGDTTLRSQCHPTTTQSDRGAPRPRRGALSPPAQGLGPRGHRSAFNPELPPAPGQRLSSEPQCPHV